MSTGEAPFRRVQSLAATPAGQVAGQVSDRPAPRYCVRVTRQLLADLHAGLTVIAGFRLVGPSEIPSPRPGYYRWWVCEDDNAPASLDGMLVGWHIIGYEFVSPGTDCLELPGRAARPCLLS